MMDCSWELAQCRARSQGHRHRSPEKNPNIILASNGAIQNSCLANSFPLYISLPLHSGKSNVLFTKAEKPEMLALAIMHDHTHFTPLTVNLPLSHPLLIGICDSHEKSLEFPITLSLFIRWYVDL